MSALAIVEPAPRTPPHNDEAEMALLGALLQNNRAYERVEEFLKPEHFANRIHGRVFEAIGKLLAKGVAADQITLRQHFEGDGDVAEVGGWSYIMQISRSVVSIINAVDYGHTIHDLYLRRQLIDIGEGMVNAAFAGDLDQDAAAQIEEVERQLTALSTDSDPGAEPVAAADMVADLMAHLERAAKGEDTGIATGIPDLDRLLGGLQDGDLVILAGRPGMGKTDCAGTIADNAAMGGHPVGIFALEMSKEQMTARSIARRTNPSVAASRQLKEAKDLTHSEWDRIVDAGGFYATLPVHLDPSGGLSVAQIRARARRLKRKHKIRLLVIDHLQLMSPDQHERSENRVQDLTKITRALKALAKELSLPIIALSQLNRGVESRDDKRPRLADLRESGSIEQDADVVIFLYRESYYLEQAEPKERADETAEKFQTRHDAWLQAIQRAYGKCEAILAKVRLGATGTAILGYEPAASRFAGLYREE